MRDAIIIFIAIILAILLGGYLFLNGAPRIDERIQSGISTADAAMVVLAEGQNSGEFTRRTNYRITTEDEFVAFWSMVYGQGGPARPNVNFAEYDVIAAMDGTHSSGGYAVRVAGVADENGRRVVRIVREEPDDACITTEAITSPFQIVRVKKSTLPITKEEEVVARQCS